MAELSKFYQVTNQIMLEYVANQYDANDTPDEKTTDYTVYIGKDGNVYYTDKPNLEGQNSDVQKSNKYDSDDYPYYSKAQYFIKFPDESMSEYTFVGLKKQQDDKYSNDSLLNIGDHVDTYTEHKDGKMHYDKIRLHFIYGFTLDRLAGITLQVKTNARYLAPSQKMYPNSNTYKMYDEYHNPIFEVESILIDDNNVVTANDNPTAVQYAYQNGAKQVEVEKLSWDYTDFYLLDIFFPKECLILHNVVKWHKSPIYQNGCFYDRYIEFLVPSAYYMSLNGDLNLSVESKYGHGELIKDENDHILNYGKIPNDNTKRILEYKILSDPTLIINFATVSEGNLTSTDPNIYASTFHQDPINQIAIKYKSNSDYFNVRIYEDTDNKEIVYYPVYGEGNNVVELSYDIWSRIENNEIPLVSKGFYDNLNLSNTDIDSFVQTYGDKAAKWIIYNEIAVTYNYVPNTRLLESDGETDAIESIESFTNIIDYSKHNKDIEGPFWKCKYIPKPKLRNNMTCKSISISYTCRLINRLTSVEAIRTATMTIPEQNVAKYYSNKTIINNVVTYKVVNQIKKEDVKQTVTYKESQPKIIRSYYDATNITIKDMNDSNIYTQGQMTLKLKHSSTNYVFRLYNLNEDNIRIPYDLTGPYRYYLVFPSNDGNKVKIKPNADSNALNLGIGQIVFYISEENVKRIMNVSSTDRYFAIVTDSDNNDSNQSTLYEGKVEYYS
ncbi:MAG: hypothetical protein [Vetruanivirus porcinprimi]|uniref:DUF4384 domain-containing protein n=1 Tax=phage Lak_Megaphage_RVC_AP1_GC26 TaxID=3109224 RepID=A0ABZ0Z814_9CAUD|nr:MAG: hypothetical protein [phage Lak_Megaphage_RVC_AP1_GC26]